MKKHYEKPILLRRQKLESVTAEVPSGVLVKVPLP